MGYYLHISQTPNTAAFEIPSLQMTVLECTTNKHGFATLTAEFRSTLYNSYYVYDRAGMPDITLTWECLTVWNGRLEDVKISGGMVRLTALGYWREVTDAGYSAVWSNTQSNVGWRIVTDADYSGTKTEKFETNLDGHIYIGLRKGETYTTSDPGALGFDSRPEDSVFFQSYEFDYSFTASSKYDAQLVSTDDIHWGGTPTTDWTITGNGATQTGTVSAADFATGPYSVMFRIVANATDTNAGETGASNLEITNFRFKSVLVADGAVSPDKVIYGAVFSTYQNLIASRAFIDANATDLTNLIYTYEKREQIIDGLVDLGDGDGNQWEVGVDENRYLYYRQRGSVARSWFVDVTDISLERTVANLYNYVAYILKDGGGNFLSLGTVQDSYSQSRFDLRRQIFMPLDTSDSAEAVDIVSAFLEDHSNPRPRVSIVFNLLQDGFGAIWPSCLARSGDLITIQNMPPGLVDADRVRSFRIAETKLNALTGTIEVFPEEPPPGLDNILARLAAGLKIGGIGKGNEITFTR